MLVCVCRHVCVRACQCVYVLVTIKNIRVLAIMCGRTDTC